MRNPSTGDHAAPPEAAHGVPDPDTSAPAESTGTSDERARTQANVKGQSAPRLPHERDESSDSGTGAPSDVVRRAHDDVVGGKTGTDKGEATDEVYRRSLRNPTPGPERD